jgi:hypothetical protein
MRISTVFLHIGAMKTGTSFLQALLRSNDAALAADGVWFPKPWRAQVTAVCDAMGVKAGQSGVAATPGAWERLAEKIRVHEGHRAVISMEFLSAFGTPDSAARVIESLHPADVHVIVTVRDATAVLPAQWQEITQNGRMASWRDYCGALLSGGDAGSGRYRAAMRALDIPSMLNVWAPLVPAERLHLITCPPSSAPRDQLWRRFASVVGIDPAPYTLPNRGSNPSIGYASATLMRRLNGRLRDLSSMEYDPVVKRVLCKRVLAAREREPPVAMTAEVVEFARGLNARIRTAVESSGGRVVGDLAELDASAKPTVADMREPPADEILRAAYDGLVGLRAWADQIRERLGRVEVPMTPIQTPSQWRERERPIPAAVDNLEAMVREGVALHNLQLPAADDNAAGDEKQRLESSDLDASATDNGAGTPPAVDDDLDRSVGLSHTGEA